MVGISTPPGNNQPAISAVAALKSIKGATQSKFYDGIPCLWSRTPVNFSYTETAAGTTRLMGTAPFAMHDFVAVFENFTPEQAPEDSSTQTSPMTLTAVLEYPANTFYPIKVGGKSTFVIAPGSLLKSDPVGIDIPAGANFWTRTYVQFAFPPTSVVATAGTGGALAAGTYYYKLTALCGDQGESGPSTEVSATVSASGSVGITLGHVASTANQTGINVYRSTTSGAEVLLTTLPGWSSSFTDAGQFTPGTATPPTVQQLWACGALDSTVRTGEATNLTHAGGTGGNQLLTSGTAWASSTGGAYAYGPSTIMGIPDQGLDVSVAGVFGDSIAYGTGDYNDRGFIALACINAKVPYLFASKGGDVMSSLAGSPTALRILKAGGVTDAVCEYGTNDIAAGSQSLATLQANAILAWSRLAKRCLRVWQTMIIPRTTSTDNWATAGNQAAFGASVNAATNATPIVITSNNFTSPPIMADGTLVIIKGCVGNTAANGTWYAKSTTYSNPNFALYQDAALTIPSVGNGTYTGGGIHSRAYVDGVRTGFNDWVRAGAPILISGTTITPTTNGTANAVYAAQTGHPLHGYFDTAAPVEVNSSNVLTQDGGFWITNGTANYSTGEGVHPTVVMHALMAAKINTALFTAP